MIQDAFPTKAIEELGFDVVEGSRYGLTDSRVFISGGELDRRLGLRALIRPPSFELILRMRDRSLLLRPLGREYPVNVTPIESVEHLRTVLELTDWPALAGEVWGDG